MLTQEQKSTAERVYAAEICGLHLRHVHDADCDLFFENHPGARKALAAAVEAVLEMQPVSTIDYTNWRGERRKREIVPQRIFFGSNEWHKEPQWLIEAIDCEDGKLKTFSVLGLASMQPKPTGKVYQVTEDDAHRCSDVYYNTNSGSYLEDHRAALQDLCDRLGLTQEPTGAAERIAELEAELSAIRSTYAEMFKQAGVESVQDIIDQRDEARAQAMTPEAKAVIDAAMNRYNNAFSKEREQALGQACSDLWDTIRAAQAKKDTDK